MAYAAQHTTASASGKSVLAILAAPFVAFGRVMIALGEANTRSQKVQRLMAMSDAELAERGLTRDKIVHHVFSDVYYI
ncbi:hypothetical protein [Pseudophaeobacter sp. A-200-2]|uniref:hypothetical protein n=1 Tax=Pseudophaeobacter sp. A-200-2 TaxID=3098145 RepID=UPI0034D642F0